MSVVRSPLSVNRCSHQNATLAMGTLEGKIVTCPLHFSRFDVTTGKKISGPVEPKMEGIDKLPPSMLAYAKRKAEIQAPIKTYDRRYSRSGLMAADLCRDLEKRKEKFNERRQEKSYDIDRY